jgi:hypothetical protein
MRVQQFYTQMPLGVVVVVAAGWLAASFTTMYPSSNYKALYRNS